MALIFADRVSDTSISTGTGDVSVSGSAPTGFRTLSAVLTTNDTFYYAIVHQTANEWEVGLGTYSASNTLTRTTVIASSNSNSAVNFSSGTKDVWLDFPAAWINNPRFTSGNALCDDAGNELIKFAKTASAVNEVTATNAATGNAPSLSATGGDTNIDINVAGKGTGVVRHGGKQAIDETHHQNSSGKLAYSSTTALTFTPFNGDMIRINGIVYRIPSGGITGLANTSIYLNGSSGQNLASSTLYYVYAFNNSGTVTADFSTTAYAVSSTTGNVGTVIKSGDDTRTLIGLIRTNGSSQFADSATQRFVRTWFNRKPIRTSNRFSTTRTWSSGSYGELNTEIRNEFVSWSDEIVALMMTGPVYNGSASVYTISAFGIDNTTPIQANGIDIVGYGYNTSTTLPSGGFTGITSGLSEGYHYATLLGKVSGGTGNWGDSGAGYYVTMGCVIG